MSTLNPGLPYHDGHPKVGTAIDRIGDLIFALQRDSVPDTVIAECLLQEVAWMIEMMGEETATPHAAAMRSIITWFSTYCVTLVAEPGRGRPDAH